MMWSAFGAAVLVSGIAVVSAQTDHSKSTKSASGSAAAHADQTFVKEAAMGGMAEVDLGKLAGDKASNDHVKAFGQRMVSDHSKANDELKSLASGKSITLPTTLDSKHKATHDRLAALSGAAFDRAYVSDMVADHKKDVAAFRHEANSGKDADVKAWAAKTLPTLEMHLKDIQDLQKEIEPTRSTRR